MDQKVTVYMQQGAMNRDIFLMSDRTFQVQNWILIVPLAQKSVNLD